MPSPPSRSTVARLRRLVWIVAIAAVGYLYLRFDNLTLPAGCSPLLRFAPGNRLLLDLRPGELAAGDAVVFEDGSGTLLLGLVEATDPEEGHWLVTDNPDCPGRASGELGWIPARSIAARILFAWPF